MDCTTMTRTVEVFSTRDKICVVLGLRVSFAWVPGQVVYYLDLKT